MDKTNFRKMFVREKKAERSIENLSKSIVPFVDAASTATHNTITKDMAQIMVVHLAKRYHMDTDSLINSEQPLTEMCYTLLAFGYAMALLDTSERAHDS